ncbi:hypothetical protein [Rhizobium leguminosarum]|uniref:hypothetical protein n=1 Tax=Rhizobium leguminosarum TaxID=384 RepID=UPI0012BC07DB|nr:hypothetical protein [Rhizobium leguminosarum]
MSEIDLQRSRRLGDLPYHDGDFKKFFWSNFEPQRAADALLDPRPSFLGYKETLLVALIAWMVKPQDPAFRRKMTVTAVAKRIENAEARATKKPGSNLVHDFDARYTKLGTFIDQVYYSVGGLATISRAISRDQIKKELVSLERPVSNIVEMVRIYHYASATAQVSPKISQRKIRHLLDLTWRKHQKVFVDRKITPYKDRKLFDIWRSYVLSAGYLYAAANTSLPSAPTLLQDLLAGNLRTTPHADWVKQWLARSQYASELIASAMTAGTSRKIRAACPTLGVEEIAFSALSNDQLNLFSQQIQ